jgi:hypothetical protein
MRFSNLLILIFILPCLCFSQKQKKTPSLKEFLSIGATPIEEQTLINNLGFFINNDYFKNDKKLTWLNGSVTSSSGDMYANIKLKFNTINNSVYIKSAIKSTGSHQFGFKNSLLQKTRVRENLSKALYIQNPMGFL